MSIMGGRSAGSAGRRRPRANISRRAVAARRRLWLKRLAAAGWLAGGAALVAATSLFFIFMYDVFTQSSYFRTRQLAVEGGARLSQSAILAQAGVQPGVNVLAVNLAAVRKRLLAHPWIAEAEVRRELPAGLHIRIREQEAAAVVEVAGRKFLLNPQGEVFKPWESTDPAGLPTVTGLAAADLRAADSRGAGRGLLRWPPGEAPAEIYRSRPLDAVLEVLALGRESDSILPDRDLSEICVDRELGLSLETRCGVRRIRLGYDNYSTKYQLLRDLLVFFRSQGDFAELDRVDLTDTQRVIVSPAKAAAPVRPAVQGG